MQRKSILNSMAKRNCDAAEEAAAEAAAEAEAAVFKVVEIYRRYFGMWNW